MRKDKSKQRALTDDQKAFAEKLITENKSIIYYTIQGVLGEVYGYLADDCVGELYLLACAKILELEKHPCPRAWMLVAARLTAHTLIKKHKTDLDNTPLELAHKTRVDTTHEDALFEIWLQNDVPQKLLRTLTKREKQIYHKLYEENKDTETVAAELDLSVSTVRSFNKLLKDKLLRYIDENI